MRRTSSGFTLIEVLLVVSIISLLSSVVLVSLNAARAKGRDARKLADSNAVRTAIAAYYLDNNKPPPKYDCELGPCIETDLSVSYAQDTVNPLEPATAEGRAYLATMQYLVQHDYLSAIPISPDDTPYRYADYGTGSLQGVVFSATRSSRSSSNSGNDSLSGPSCGVVSTCGIWFMKNDGDTYSMRECVFPYPSNNTTVECTYVLFSTGEAVYSGGDGCPAQLPCTGPDTYCSCMPY